MDSRKYWLVHCLVENNVIVPIIKLNKGYGKQINLVWLTPLDLVLIALVDKMQRRWRRQAISTMLVAYVGPTLSYTCAVVIYQKLPTSWIIVVAVGKSRNVVAWTFFFSLTLLFKSVKLLDRGCEKSYGGRRGSWRTSSQLLIVLESTRTFHVSIEVEDDRFPFIIAFAMS